MPVDWDTDVSNDWNDWGKWSANGFSSSGGESGPSGVRPGFGFPFLSVNCICTRSRTGTRTTEKKTKYRETKACFDCDGFSSSYREYWETKSLETRDVAEQETKMVPGGFAGNNSSASFLCEEKCKKLNL